MLWGANACYRRVGRHVMMRVNYNTAPRDFPQPKIRRAGKKFKSEGRDRLLGANRDGFGNSGLSHIVIRWFQAHAGPRVRIGEKRAQQFVIERMPGFFAPETSQDRRASEI